MIPDRPITPGWVFKPERGKLYIFGQGRIVVLRGWPEIRAWSKEGEGGFCPCRPRLSRNLFRTTPPKPTRQQGKGPPATREAVRYRRELTAWEFSQTLSQEIRILMARFESGHYELLQGLAAGGRAAQELASTNPALFLRLVRNDAFHQPRVRARVRAVRTWCDKKRHHLAGWLGWPATKQVVRILARLWPEDVATWRLHRLRRLVQEPAVIKLLSHLPLTDARGQRLLRGEGLDMLWALAGPEGAFDPSAAEGLAPLMVRDESPQQENAQMWLRDSQCMSLDLGGVWPPCPRLRSMEELQRLHHDLALRQRLELRSKALIEFMQSAFPPAPLPGCAHIAPVSNPRDLLEEGDFMGHCIASFHRQIRAGAYYVYRVWHPERATLGIRREASGYWRVTELKLARNGAPSEESWQVVHDWLAAVQPTAVDDPF